MDLEELYAIEDFKHGQRKRLATWLETQHGKPLSPLLQAFLPEMGKSTFRKQGGQAKPWKKAEIKLAILFAEVTASLNTDLHGLPSSKKAILLDAAKMTGLSLKSIERVAYRKTSGRPSK